MKSLTQREIRLAAATVVIVLLGITWMVVQARVAFMREAAERRDAALLESRRQEVLLQKRPDLLQEFQMIRGQLPRHPEGQDLKPEFARKVQSLAEQTGLELTALTPEPEEGLQDLDLYRSAVQGSWSGTPPQILGFLYQLQQLGAVADVSDLRVRKRSRRSEELSGNFLIEFVYARIPPSVEDAEATPSPQSPNDGAME